MQVFGLLLDRLEKLDIPAAETLFGGDHGRPASEDALLDPTHEPARIRAFFVIHALDGGLSAQFEHTIGVTAKGCEIFTLSPAGLHCPPYKV